MFRFRKSVPSPFSVLVHIDYVYLCESKIFASLEIKSEEATIAGLSLIVGSVWI